MVDHVGLLHLPISHLPQRIHTWEVMVLVYQALAHKVQVSHIIFTKSVLIYICLIQHLQ